MKYRYSPLEIKAYRIPGIADCPVRVIEEAKNRDELWNAYWLSTPTIEAIPMLGPEWYRRHEINIKLLPALIYDVDLEPGFAQHLAHHPEDFAAWWKEQDHTSYYTYKVLGGEPWVQSVLDRAYEAMARIEGTVV